MEIGNYVSEQLILFFRSIGLGLCLGLLYDLLGALRGLGGKIWGGTLDVLFCLTAAVSVFFFIMAGDGELRIFMALGILGGAVLFWCLLGGPLRPVWAFWLEMALLPARLIWEILKKCGRFVRKVFSFWRKWITIKFTTPRRERKSRHRREKRDGQTGSEEEKARD